MNQKLKTAFKEVAKETAGGTARATVFAALLSSFLYGMSYMAERAQLPSPQWQVKKNGLETTVERDYMGVLRLTDKDGNGTVDEKYVNAGRAFKVYKTNEI